jgi:5-methylcytosine-specific restriction endonuclease McrA
MKRICLDCGRPIPATETRCPDHRKPRRYYGGSWRKTRAAILTRDSHRCHYCGGKATTIDHVLPLERGGTNDPANLVAACGRCNYSKQEKTVEEWRPDWTEEHALREKLRAQRRR